MSLLDDVSIVVTPNGYKAGELYAVIPSDGTADMDVTRATDATRVDEDGLIADVLSNVPRIDYTGGGCPHILSEPQRTNLFPYSEDFSQTDWVKNDQTLSLSTVLSPNGTTFSYKATATADNSKMTDTLSLLGTTTYTVSFYANNISGVDPQILVWDNDNSAVLLSQSYGSELISDEWVRIVGSFTTTTAASVQLQVTRNLDDTEEMLIWGAQVEAGSYATSYIPTSGTSVTRNQDLFSRDGIGSLIGSEGVFYAEFKVLHNYLQQSISISDGTINTRVLMYVTSGGAIRGQIKGSATVGVNDASGATATDFNKVAIRYKDNQVDLSVNGATIVTNTTTNTSPTTLNELSFTAGAAGSGAFEGQIRSIQVYDTALTDVQLTSLTS